MAKSFFLGIKPSTSVFCANLKKIIFSEFCSKFLTFLCFFLSAQKTLKTHILTSIWSVQHPEAGWNIQHLWLVYNKMAWKPSLLNFLVNSVLPEVEKSIALTPNSMDSFVYLATSRSARRSKSRHEESSGTKSTKLVKLLFLWALWLLNPTCPPRERVGGSVLMQA